jgi:hypothetical protein
MTAARIASPEGWQVSVRCSLFGVDQRAAVNGGCRKGPVLEVKSAGGRALGAFLGVVLGVHCWAWCEQC